MEKYQKMWRYMESNEADTFVSSYREGVERVLSGNYAFLCESTMLHYLLQRNCNLTQIGGLLDNKGYGIATPKGSKWRDRISDAILFLQEKGVIQMYYDKWWKKRKRKLRGNGVKGSGEPLENEDDFIGGEEWDDDEDDESEEGSCGSGKKKSLNEMAMASSLGVVNIGGIFVVLLCGLAFAVTVAVVEFCYGRKAFVAYMDSNKSMENADDDDENRERGERRASRAKRMKRDGFLVRTNLSEFWNLTSTYYF